MQFQLIPESISAWPPLAWLACLKVGSTHVTVWHGPSVEIHQDWICEAVWNGDFSNGNFDQTDIVVGSGLRAREQGVVFVSAGNTVDRLHSIELSNETWLSNSLPCLLSAVEAKLDDSYPSYYEDIGSIVKGLGRYQPVLVGSRGPVRLTYFHNLLWNGTHLDHIEKPVPARDFSNFELYRDFLSSTMKLVIENAVTGDRSRPFGTIGTVSRGYDSLTSTVLSRENGCRDALCFDDARRQVNDNAEDLARSLGLNVTVVDRYQWRQNVDAESVFVAGDAKGEDVFIWGAKNLVAGRLVFTGYHGDSVWAKQVHDLSRDLVRGDRSGLSLCEARLRIGCVHCPVPFWGATRIHEINLISNSPVMSYWDWPAGYSRPICRRIVEEAGIQREQFGSRKNVSSIMFRGRSAQGFGRCTSKSFNRWLQAKNPGAARIVRFVNTRFLRQMEMLSLRVLRKLGRLARKGSAWTRALKSIEALVDRYLDWKSQLINRHFFIYAIEHCKKAYRRRPGDARGSID